MHTCGRGEDWHYLIDPKVVSNEIGVRYPTECSTQLKLKHVPCIFVWSQSRWEPLVSICASWMMTDRADSPKVSDRFRTVPNSITFWMLRHVSLLTLRVPSNSIVPPSRSCGTVQSFLAAESADIRSRMQDGYGKLTSAIEHPLSGCVPM